jgi:hypothetical protein
MDFSFSGSLAFRFVGDATGILLQRVGCPADEKNLSRFVVLDEVEECLVGDELRNERPQLRTRSDASDSASVAYGYGYGNGASFVDFDVDHLIEVL